MSISSSFADLQLQTPSIGHLQHLEASSQGSGSLRSRRGQQGCYRAVTAQGLEGWPCCSLFSSASTLSHSVSFVSAFCSSFPSFTASFYSLFLHWRGLIIIGMYKVITISVSGFSIFYLSSDLCPTTILFSRYYY